jgi:hypothetical protein
MADNDPSLSASPATHVAAAQAASVTAHPVRKFKHALLALAKFWPFWIFILVAVVAGGILERISRGAITRNTPVIGPWAIQYAAGGSTAAAPAAGSPTAVVVADSSFDAATPPA